MIPFDDVIMILKRFAKKVLKMFSGTKVARVYKYARREYVELPGGRKLNP